MVDNVTTTIPKAKRRLSDARHYAIIRKCWKLNNDEREMLDAYFMLRVSCRAFNEALFADEDQNYRDLIKFKHREYDVEFNNCGSEYMEQHEDRQVLLSMRRSRSFGVCLVHVPEKELTPEQWAVYGQFEDGSSE